MIFPAIFDGGPFDGSTRQIHGDETADGKRLWPTFLSLQEIGGDYDGPESGRAVIYVYDHDSRQYVVTVNDLTASDDILKTEVFSPNEMAEILMDEMIKSEINDADQPQQPTDTYDLLPDLLAGLHLRLHTLEQSRAPGSNRLTLLLLGTAIGYIIGSHWT